MTRSRRDDVAAACSLADRDGPGMVLTGPAGIGKTRVARDAMRALAARDVVVAWVQATTMAGRIPFGAMAPYLPPIDHSADVLPILVTATRALRELGGGRRVVVVVDDAPLLDDASTLLLAQSVAAGDVRLLATQRAGEPLPEALATLRLPRRELGALDEAAVVALAEELAGGVLAPSTRTRLVRLSGGNPLYLHELVLAGHEAGAWSHGDDGLVLDERVGGASRLTELVGSRFDGLPDDAADAVALLAVGEPLGLSTLEAMVSTSAVEHLDEAGLVDVVVDGRRTQLRLAHPIYAEVLRQQMSVLRRRRLARRLAEQLQVDGGRRRDDLMRSATWYLDAGGEVPAGVLADAARHARLAGDVALAERFARTSMAAAPSFAAGHLLADTLYRQGRTAEVTRVLDDVEMLELSVEQRAACGMTRAADQYWNGGDLVAAEAAIARAVAEAADPTITTTATALRASLLASSRRFREAEALARGCLDGPPSRSVIDAALAIGFCTRARGCGEEAVRIVDRTLATYSSFGEDVAMMTMQVIGSVKTGALVDLGRLDEADAAAAATLEAARATREDAALGFVGLCIGWSEFHRGRFRSAIDEYRIAEQHLRALNRPGMQRWAVIGGFYAAVSAGDLALAATTRERLLGLGSHPATLFDGVLGRADAALLRCRGEAERARALLLEVAAEAAALDDLTTEGGALHDLVRAGRPELAVDRLTALADRLEGAWIGLFARHARAAVAGDAAALGDVADGFAALGAMAFAADAALEAADAWSVLGDQRSATRWRRRAADLAVDVERDAAPSAAGLGGADPLTRREREIVELAATGLTSKEVGARLFVSARTVESHLLRAYAKLGVRTRAELAELLGTSTPGSS